jgi:membrane-bound ClpP family serine protease
MRGRLLFSAWAALVVFGVLLALMLLARLALEVIGPVWLGVAVLVAGIVFLVVFLVETITERDE